MKHDGQKQVGEEGFMSLTVPYNSSSSKAVRSGTQAGRNLDAGAEAEAMGVGAAH